MCEHLQKQTEISFLNDAYSSNSRLFGLHSQTRIAKLSSLTFWLLWGANVSPPNAALHSLAVLTATDHDSICEQQINVIPSHFLASVDASLFTYLLYCLNKSLNPPTKIREQEQCCIMATTCKVLPVSLLLITG